MAEKPVLTFLDRAIFRGQGQGTVLCGGGEADMSQRDLAQQLQLMGMDMDKNVITRIETNKRYVTDLELRALRGELPVSH